MRKEIIEDFFDVADLMLADFYEGDQVAFVGNYEDVVQLLRNFFLIDDEEALSVGMIEMIDPNFGDYEYQYVLSLIEGGSLWIDKACKDSGELFNMDGEYGVVYTRPENASAVAEVADNVCVVCYEDEEVENSNRSLHLVTDNEGKLKGFVFNDEGPGVCFNMDLCSCEEIDAEYLTNLIDRLIGAYVER